MPVQMENKRNSGKGVRFIRMLGFMQGDIVTLNSK